MSIFNIENNKKLNLPNDYGLHKYEENEKYYNSIKYCDDLKLYIDYKLRKSINK